MITAYDALQTIKKEQIALLEYPIAQLSTLTANINRDSKYRKQPFSIKDFLLFTTDTETDQIRPEAGAAALTIRAAGGMLPSAIYGVWPAIVAAAQQCTKPPEIRALISSCGTVGLFAPIQEHQNWRGLLVVSRQPEDNTIQLFDHDRPLLGFTVLLPNLGRSYVVDRELIRAI